MKLEFSEIIVMLIEGLERCDQQYHSALGANRLDLVAESIDQKVGIAYSYLNCIFVLLNMKNIWLKNSPFL